MSEASILNPLRSESQHIRLFHVDTSGSGQHDLLTDVLLSGQRIRYVALSYVWGTKAKKQIMVNRTKITISDNLDLALQMVINFWRAACSGRRGELYLWIDQICIDQTNNREKSHQINLMGEIYRRADEVLVWLPSSKILAPPVFDNFYYRRWPGVSSDIEISLDLPGFDAITLFQHRAVECLRPSRVDIHGIRRPSCDFHTHPDMVVDWASHGLFRVWRAIQIIIASSWWERAWTYQEFVFSDQATFLFEGIWVSWQYLFTLIQYFSDHVTALCTSKINELTSLLSTTTDFLKYYRSWRAWPVSKMTISNLEEIHDCIQARIELLERFQQDHKDRLESDRWGRVRHILRHRDLLRTKSYQPMSLSALLEHSWTCEATDDRDKVYAFYGVAGVSYEIIPDYSLPVNKVFIEAARALIIHDKTLRSLDIALETAKSYPTKDLRPSWVANWAQKKSTVYGRMLSGIGLNLSRCNASQGRKPFVSFSGTILLTKAIKVGQLLKVVEETPSKYMRKFRTENDREVTTTNRAREGDEIWLLLGCVAPFVLRLWGADRILCGHAMIWEAERPSNILDGSLITALDAGQVSLEDISIV